MKKGGSAEYDVAVIGAGASGSVAVSELCSRGHKVALIDAAPADHFAPTHITHALRNYPIQRKSEAFNNTTKHLFVNDIENPYSSTSLRPFSWIRSRSLGGRLNLWTGECYPLSDLDFKAASYDGYGIDWPLSYDDLSGYYAKAEELLQVKGNETPFGPNESFVVEKLNSLGLPVMADRQASQSAGKFPNLQNLIHVGESTGKLSYFPGHVVHSLEVKCGKIGSVRSTDISSGKEQRVKARSYVLCASTIESTRIILNSRLEKAQGHHVVGKYLNDSVGGPKSILYEGQFSDRDENFTPFEKRALYIPRHQNIDGTGKWPFKRGYVIRVFLYRVNPFTVNFAITGFGCSLSYEENCVELDLQKRDAWSKPAVNIKFQFQENERRMFECLKWDIKNIATALTEGKNGTITNVVEDQLAPGLCNHEVGTCRMGDSYKNSFLNSYCRSHDIENLYITDGSSFSGTGTANPTLSIMALTYRATEDLSKRL